MQKRIAQSRRVDGLGNAPGLGEVSRHRLPPHDAGERLVAPAGFFDQARRLKGGRKVPQGGQLVRDTKPGLRTNLRRSQSRRDLQRLVYRLIPGQAARQGDEGPFRLFQPRGGFSAFPGGLKPAVGRLLFGERRHHDDSDRRVGDELYRSGRPREVVQVNLLQTDRPQPQIPHLRLRNDLGGTHRFRREKRNAVRRHRGHAVAELRRQRRRRRLCRGRNGQQSRSGDGPEQQVRQLAPNHPAGTLFPDRGPANLCDKARAHYWNSCPASRPAALMARSSKSCARSSGSFRVST